MLDLTPINTLALLALGAILSSLAGAEARDLRSLDASAEVRERCRRELNQSGARCVKEFNQTLRGLRDSRGFVTDAALYDQSLLQLDLCQLDAKKSEDRCKMMTP